ncbi:1-(5-phosphoribosyl)-5-[(5-phosphoribosylamino)methylideneamino]imidazole-4-carboxamide isomerase [Pirellulaceae bacterium SH467]
MEIWPAIDLLGGNCVRLQQGDYGRDTVFSHSPGDVAKRWFDEGSQFLHCVDLDGAKSGSVVNETAIREIVAAANGRPVQLGGGVRNVETIQRLLDLGLSRLVVGTSALKNPNWFAEMCDRFPGHLVLGLDAWDGKVATEGWLKTSETTASDLVAGIGTMTKNCVAVVYTDISKDGMMSGPNFDSLAELENVSPFPVICSGGVTTLDDIRRLVAQGTHGAILGRTLYEGHIRLADVLTIAG